MFEGNLTSLWRSIIKEGENKRENTDLECSSLFKKHNRSY